MNTQTNNNSIPNYDEKGIVKKKKNLKSIESQNSKILKKGSWGLQ